MQLEHSFEVPVPIEQAWPVLLDIERIAPCMPGAALDTVDGDEFTGSVKVKLGPIGLTYKGKASFAEKDESAHRAVIDARGRDARGNGTANAKVTATLTDAGGKTKVDVTTDLDITGKPAQFGRGVMVDVGNKLIGQFASCLAEQLTGGGDPPDSAGAAAEAAVLERAAQPDHGGSGNGASAGAAAAGSTAGSAGSASKPAAPAQSAAPKPTSPAKPAAPSPAPRAAEPINLIESAGPAVAKRLAPLAAGIVVLLLVLRRRRKP